MSSSHKKRSSVKLETGRSREIWALNSHKQYPMLSNDTFQISFPSPWGETDSISSAERTTRRKACHDRWEPHGCRGKETGMKRKKSMSGENEGRNLLQHKTTTKFLRSQVERHGSELFETRPFDSTTLCLSVSQAATDAFR